jgi:hypothetical protein
VNYVSNGGGDNALRCGCAFPLIARLAGGNNVGPVVPAAARERHDVVAGEEFRTFLAAAIATEMVVALE